jgi:hypothetical protein
MMFFVFCYLAMIGVLLDQHKNYKDLSKSDYVALFCAPIVIPILIGMYINNKQDE